ncbi:AI-2E family transporter YdiK [Variovorax dokdonensis]|uniref:AI-2E family transporter YdiK n=1 Tax=Variovorax dokdonensis TaxID=344883 RepID=A0ABT7N5N2_9BURK|nr:AI-2E family transporter YdiK [Variovorax dokdonensis]MDM0043259.1 AI-2E family transporter YdiK [Variovorax dokdonensis]
MTEPRTDLAKITFSVLCIALMIGSSLWILRPFLGATIWAAMVVVASWPALLWFQARLWGSRALAVVAMVLILLLLFALPLTMAISTVAEHADVAYRWVRSLIDQGPPHLPDWLRNLPLVGAKLGSMWDELVASGMAGLQHRVTPYLSQVTTWVLSQAGVVGALTVQILLTVVIAGVMYASGEAAARVVQLFGWRVAGTRGQEAVVLAGKAIRGVALGVGVTALVQAVIGGIGLAVAGVPLAALLTAVMFMLCIIQLGPTLVLLPATIWVFWNGDTGWGVFMAVWTLIVGTMDNFLRPWLIKRGADLPLLLIFAGVIGGLFAFGLVGVFVGPVLLAVSYTLIHAWLHDGEADMPAL